MEQIKRYQQQYIEFTKFDDFTLEDRAKKVPAEKHFWVSRLIEAKIEKERLLREKKNHRQQLVKDMVANSPVALNKQTMMQDDSFVELSDILDKIKEQEFLIEYLELIVKQITFIAQDIKNIIMIKQLEQT
jgi:hypothetical protein